MIKGNKIRFYNLPLLVYCVVESVCAAVFVMHVVTTPLPIIIIPPLSWNPKAGQMQFARGIDDIPADDGPIRLHRIDLLGSFVPVAGKEE